MINVVINAKGGVGKTTVANHILPFLTNSKTIFEIDSSNFSSIYSLSTKIEGKTIETTQQGLEDAVDDASFLSLAQQKNILIDTGAGEDSRRTIQALKASGLTCTYWMPIMADMEALHPLYATRELIGDAECNLVFSNFRNLEEDFWFVYGDSRHGFDKDFEIFKHFDNMLKAPNTTLFAKCKAFNTTIWDMAEIHKGYKLEEAQVEWGKQGREAWGKNMAMHRLSTASWDYLQQVKETLAPCKGGKK